MKKIKPNVIFAIGLLMMSGVQIINRFIVEIPEPLMLIFMIVSLFVEIYGIVKMARSPEMKNSRLRKWKMKLIGKDK